MSEPIPFLRLTVLTDNTVYRAGLGAEHGLSVLIETPHHTILFDTGQTNLWLDNARALHVDLSKIDMVVLSHGHYDHAGGLLAAFDVLSPDVPVHAHPAVWTKRWACRKGFPPRYIGMDERLEHQRDRFRLHEKATEISPGVTFLGSITRCYDEGVGLRGFYLDRECKEPDRLVDDTGLLLDTQAGLLLLTGCGHAGVNNYLEHVRRLAPGRPWAMVMGGLHLRSAPEEQLEQAVQALEHARVPRAGVMHCTGPQGLNALWQANSIEVHALSVGATVTLHRDGRWVAT